MRPDTFHIVFATIIFFALAISTFALIQDTVRKQSVLPDSGAKRLGPGSDQVETWSNITMGQPANFPRSMDLNVNSITMRLSLARNYSKVCLNKIVVVYRVNDDAFSGFPFPAYGLTENVSEILQTPAWRATGVGYHGGATVQSYPSQDKCVTSEQALSSPFETTMQGIGATSYDTQNLQVNMELGEETQYPKYPFETFHVTVMFIAYLDFFDTGDALVKKESYLASPRIANQVDGWTVKESRSTDMTASSTTVVVVRE